MTKSKNIIFLITYIISFLIIVTFWNIIQFKFIKSDFVSEIVWFFGRIIIWIIPVFIYLKYVDTVNPIDYLKLKSNLKHGIKWGLMLGFAWLLLGLLTYIEKSRSVKYSDFNLGIDLIKCILAGFSLEITFRGFLLQKIESLTNFWVGNILATLIYILSDFLFLIFINPQLIFGRNVIYSIYAIIGGLLLGLIFKKTNSIWSAAIVEIIFLLTSFIWL